ncbi:MAG: hypothetical protein V9F04_17085 [Dermatophilaceae bacterium]
MTHISADAVFCPRCGQALGPAGMADEAHAACRRALDLEPPRYCPECRRRMVVQITPADWTARCVEHGETTESTWAPA